MEHFKKYNEYGDFLNEAKVTFSKAGIKAKFQEKIEALKKSKERSPEDTWQDKSIAKIEAAIKSGKFDWKNHPYISGPKVEGQFDIFTNSNATMCAKELVKIIKKYKKYEVKPTSVGAAPNSTRFRAAVGGMIELMVNEPVYDGIGGKNLLLGIKVGGGISSSVRDKIFQEAYEKLMPLEQHGGEGGGISIHTSDGTNWGAIGLANSKLGFNSFIEKTLKDLS